MHGWVVRCCRCCCICCLILNCFGCANVSPKSTAASLGLARGVCGRVDEMSV